MRARSVVDAVLASTRGATLKADKLRHQAIIAWQDNAPAVQQRQQVAIEIALGLLRHDVADPMTAKQFARELARIPITNNLANTVALEQHSEVSNHALR